VSIEIWQHLARTLQQKGDFEKAIQTYLQILELVPDGFDQHQLAKLYEELAHCYEQIGDYQQAVHTLRETISIHNMLNSISSSSPTIESQRKTSSSRFDDELMNRHLEHADRLIALGKMVASIAHEINNPIQVIYINLLQFGIENDSPALMRSIEQIEHITLLISKMREMYEFEARPVSLLDCNEVIQNVITLINQQLVDAQIVIELDFIVDLPMIQASITHIQQVIFNIILNAIDAMHQGGILSIKTRYDTETKNIALHFIDTGDGIKENDFPHIFEPFFTTRKDGSGLGLSVCQNIIAHYNGQLTAKSPGIGQGATFIVYFKVYGE